jgi:drug/metabolite transporter (DMT)-like permease
VQPVTRSRSESAIRLALGAAVLSVALQSMGPIFIRKAGFSGLTFAFHRMWAAALVYAVIASLRGRHIRWTTIRASAPGGLLFAFNVAMFFMAVERTSIANATVIGALQPVAILMVVNRLFGERPATHEVLWTFVSIAGVGIVVFGSGAAETGSPEGDVFALVAMFGYAGYFIASKRARATLGAFEYQAALSIVASAILAPVVLLSGEPLAAPRASSWLWVVAMVALPGTGHMLTNYAHAYLRLSIISVMTLLVPVSATLLAWAWLGERLVLWQAVGMVVVVAALSIMVTTSATTPAVGDRRP